MSEGQITENTATEYGGGVTIDGTCTISGDAEITKNSAVLQDGEVHQDSSTALFTMNGGKIAGNMVVTGKPSFDNNWGGGVFIQNGKFVMNAGTIAENRVPDKGTGAAVVVNAGTTFTMPGGEISGNFATGTQEFYHSGTKLTVGGGAVIDTNSTYIANNRYITVLSNFTGYVHNITPYNITNSSKHVEFPAGTDESKFEGKFTLASSVINKNKKLKFFPEDLPVLRIQDVLNVGIIDGVLGDGSSSGKYAVGEKVTVTASIPHGKKFLRWAANQHHPH